MHRVQGYPLCCTRCGVFVHNHHRCRAQLSLPCVDAAAEEGTWELLHPSAALCGEATNAVLANADLLWHVLSFVALREQCALRRVQKALKLRLDSGGMMERLGLERFGPGCFVGAPLDSEPVEIPRQPPRLDTLACPAVAIAVHVHSSLPLREVVARFTASLGCRSLQLSEPRDLQSFLLTGRALMAPTFTGLCALDGAFFPLRVRVFREEDRFWGEEYAGHLIVMDTARAVQEFAA